jgi:putative serine protease XkdF
MVLEELLIGDPSVSKALLSVYGRADKNTLAIAMRGSNSDISKAITTATPIAPARPAPPSSSARSSMPRPKQQGRMAPIKAASIKPIGLIKPLGAKAVLKSDDPSGLTFTTEISKVDEDEHTVFGWASITEIDGEPVVDRQGDTIDIEELSKAAYDYVIKSRAGGHQHRRDDNDLPLKVSDMIESVVFTPEKIEKMGLPPSTPIGWWCGFHVSDDQTWQDIKNGEVTGLSVHGRGRRIPIPDEEVARLGFRT